MKIVLLFISLFFIVSCGNNEESTSSQREGLLTIPQSGSYGGSPSINSEGQNYTIDFNSSSQNAYSYIQSLSYGGAGVQAYGQSTTGIIYRVRFSGEVIQSQCPFNPMATCTNLRLTSIQAY